jgi:hypothetical protein
MRALLAAGLALFAFAATPASAFVGDTPDQGRTAHISTKARAYWLRSLDTSGNMVLRTPDGHAVLKLAIYASDEAPDAVVAEIANRANASMPQKEDGTVSIAGLGGTSYLAQANDASVHLRFIVAPSEPGYVLVVMVVTTDTLSGGEDSDVSGILSRVAVAKP